MAGTVPRRSRDETKFAVLSGRGKPWVKWTFISLAGLVLLWLIVRLSLQ